MAYPNLVWWACSEALARLVARPVLAPLQIKGLVQLEGVNITELAYLRLLRERVPNASPQHVLALLCLLREKDSWVTMHELEQSTTIHNGELKKIMQQFAAKQLVEQDGCLFRRPERERILAIIAR